MPRQRRRPRLGADDVPGLRRPRPASLSAGLLHRGPDLPSMPRDGPGDRQALHHVPRRRARCEGPEADGEDPAGHRHRSAAPLDGEGEHGAAGGPPGDLYVVIQVRDHEFFRRDGNDLYCEIPVDFPTLALGGDVMVPSILGDPESLKVPGRARRQDRPTSCAGRGCPTSPAVAAAICSSRSRPRSRGS